VTHVVHVRQVDHTVRLCRTLLQAVQVRQVPPAHGSARLDQLRGAGHPDRELPQLVDETLDELKGVIGSDG